MDSRKTIVFRVVDRQEARTVGFRLVACATADCTLSKVVSWPHLTDLGLLPHAWFCEKLCLLCSERAVKTCFVLGLRTDWNTGHGTQRDTRMSMCVEELERVFFLRTRADVVFSARAPDITHMFLG